MYVYMNEHNSINTALYLELYTSIYQFMNSHHKSTLQRVHDT